MTNTKNKQRNNGKQEYEAKSKNLSKNEEETIGKKFMTIFYEFGKPLHFEPGYSEVQNQVKNYRIILRTIIIPVLKKSYLS